MAIAVIITAVVVLQPILLDKWHFCTWGTIYDGLLMSLMLFTAKATSAHTRSRDMGSISKESRHDGRVPTFIELVEDATVFANCKSWKTKYHAKKNDVFMTLCTPKLYNGYNMIPLFGGGALQVDLVRPCSAAVIASSFHRPVR